MSPCFRLGSRGGRCAIGLVLALLLLPAILATPAAAAQPASRPFRDCPTCPELVRIAPGRFLMGSTDLP